MNPARLYTPAVDPTPSSEHAQDADDEGRRHGLRCRACGSFHLRRSHARNGLERLGRALTPLRFHRCADCGERGYHLAWSTEPSVRPRHLVRPAPPPGRRQELRDAVASRLHRRRLVVSVILAACLGALVAMLVLAR